MPSFAYKAVSTAGQDLAGELEAPDRPAALRELIGRGVHVLEIDEKTQKRGLLGAGSAAGGGLRLRPRQLAALTRQLATSLEAGLPLLTALDVMCRELDHAPSRELLRRLATRVQTGASLSEALADYPRVFEPMYVRLVRVGETGGMLDSVLGQMADLLERRIELRERVKTASIYPSIVLLLGIASVIIIVAVIVPRIIESIGSDTFLLPWPTRAMMAASGFVREWGWLLLALAVGLGFGWRQAVLHGPWRAWWDATKLRLPMLGRLIRQLEASRFARSLGMLVHGGVTLTEALPVVRDTLQNQVLCQAVGRVTESIHSGEPIAAPLQRSGLFPPLLVQMVRVGEHTGRLDEMLLRAAQVHEAQARVTLDRFVSVLPVLMILALACVIGFIVAGLVLAIVEFQTVGVGAMGR